MATGPLRGVMAAMAAGRVTVARCTATATATATTTATAPTGALETVPELAQELEVEVEVLHTAAIIIIRIGGQAVHLVDTTPGTQGVAHPPAD